MHITVTNVLCSRESVAVKPVAVKSVALAGQPPEQIFIFAINEGALVQRPRKG